MGLTQWSLVAAALWVQVSATSSAAPEAVFISAQEAEGLLRGEVRVLDARGGDAEAPYLPGAVVVDWRDVRAGFFREGRLGDVQDARSHYQARGVHIDRPVLVYGAWDDGWGEEGRIWWDLRVLGHAQVFVLEGGLRAWREKPRAVLSTPSKPKPGHFPERTGRPDLRVEHREVHRMSARGEVVLDARTPEEFAGATPYYSSRGGHVPGAKSLPWRSVLDPRGGLRAEVELRELAARAGLRPGGRVAAYCTGGVRSAFLVAVLRHLGFRAANYDGSWWDWSSRSELPTE